MHQLAPRISQQMKQKYSTITKIHNNLHKKRILSFSNSNNKISKKRSNQSITKNTYNKQFSIDFQNNYNHQRYRKNKQKQDEKEVILNQQQSQHQKNKQKDSTIKTLIKSRSIQFPDIYTMITKTKQQSSKQKQKLSSSLSLSAQNNNLLSMAFKNHVGNNFKTKRLYGLIKDLDFNQKTFYGNLNNGNISISRGYVNNKKLNDQKINKEITNQQQLRNSHNKSSYEDLGGSQKHSKIDQYKKKLQKLARLNINNINNDKQSNLNNKQKYIINITQYNQQMGGTPSPLLNKTLNMTKNKDIYNQNNNNKNDINKKLPIKIKIKNSQKERYKSIIQQQHYNQIKNKNIKSNLIIGQNQNLNLNLNQIENENQNQNQNFNSNIKEQEQQYYQQIYKSRKPHYFSLDASKSNQKLNIYNMTLNNMNLHNLSSNSNNKNSKEVQNRINYQNNLISFSPPKFSNNTLHNTLVNNNHNNPNNNKKFPIIFVPKSSMSNYYQPKYRSQYQQQRRIKQQYLDYIHRVQMQAIHHQKKMHQRQAHLQGQSMQLRNQTRLQQLKKQAEKMKQYIQSMRSNASLTFTMALHDRRKSMQFQKRQNQKKYSQDKQQSMKQKKRRTKKIQLDLNQKLEYTPWGQQAQDLINLSDFLKKM